MQQNQQLKDRKRRDSAILVETVIPRRDRKLCPTVDTGEGLTEQSHKDQCDINVILDDYKRTGFIKHAKQNAGRYDDVSAVDFEKAAIIVANVKSLFENLPSHVRDEFQGEAANFLRYVQNPSNHAELAQRGILVGNDGLDISGAYVKTPVKKDSPAAQAGKPAEQSGQPSESAAVKPAEQAAETSAANAAE